MIVLLYVLDNDTNTLVRISVGVGLLIELWKINKVINVEVNHNDKIFGIFPKISFSDKGSYKESPTKSYDIVRLMRHLELSFDSINLIFLDGISLFIVGSISFIVRIRCIFFDL